MTAPIRDTAPRVLLAAGDQTLEQRLARELPEHGVTVARRALDASGLIEAASASDVDVALISADLHRLSESTLHALRARGLPTVLLANDPAYTERFGTLTRVLPAGASAATIATALDEARARGLRPLESAPERPGGEMGPVAAPEPGRGGRVIAVVSGKGAPGRTTIAIAFATEWRRAGMDTVLLDADLRGGNVAAYLDLDPRRGLVGAAAGAGALAERVETELQSGAGCAVLAGVERPELAVTLSPELLGEVLVTLRARFERVVVDLGVPPEPALLRAADELVVVVGADLVSIWNAQAALPALRQAAPAARFHILINRREGREHYTPEEIARVLDVPVLGAVGEDRKAARRAITEQVPLSETRSGAARDLRAAAHALLVGDAGVSARRPLEAAAGRLAVER